MKSNEKINLVGTVDGGRYNLFKDILSHGSAPEIKKLHNSIADFINVKTYDGVDIPVVVE